MNTISYLGIDVSKAHLDVAFSQRSTRITNAPKSITSFVASLPAASHLVLEATGGYERPLVQAAHQMGVRVSVLNPARVRAFALSKGCRAKTDKIDAAILRDFGDALHPAPRQAQAPELSALAELVNARDKLVAIRCQLDNALEHVQLTAIRQIYVSQVRSLKNRVAKLDAAILKLLKNTPSLASRYQCLTAHYGVGQQTAATLLAHLPQLGEANRSQLASLAGLAPFNRDSGKTKGPRFTSGGKPRVRRCLYLAALTAIRSDSPLRTFYLRLRQSGKPAKLALVASARKLLAHLNASIKKLHA